MILDTFLIPDLMIPISLLSVGSLGAHQLFLLAPNTSAPYLKSEGSVYLFQMTGAVSGLAGLKKTSRITPLIYAFQKAVRDHDESSQALEERSYGISTLGGFESSMGWSSSLTDYPPLCRRMGKKISAIFSNLDLPHDLTILLCQTYSQQNGFLI